MCLQNSIFTAFKFFFNICIPFVTLKLIFYVPQGCKEAEGGSNTSKHVPMQKRVKIQAQCQDALLSLLFLVVTQNFWAKSVSISALRQVLLYWFHFILALCIDILSAVQISVSAHFITIIHLPIFQF